MPSDSPHVREVLLGNGAIARGLIEAGCEVATAYPGTPSTEILEEIERQRDVLGIALSTEWSVNEKIAFDVALAASMCGKRAAVAMKQVGLNVASDSLLSAAYTGCLGGFVVVVADDPGPHSSQTEQDTRLFAGFAKVPVLDPSTPREARAMAMAAMELSERRRIPVLLRPTTRVCHSRQAVEAGPPDRRPRPAKFSKDPERWAATPRFRLPLHGELNAKLEAIRAEFESSPFNVEECRPGPVGIIAGGCAAAAVRDVLTEEELDIPVLRIGTPYPLPLGLVIRFIDRHDRVLVIEEPDAAIEMQIPDRRKVHGRLTGHVPGHGELTPEIVASLLGCPAAPPAPPSAPLPPRLCPGCGHRSVFYELRLAMPGAIFAGDIGCYTLGTNQRAIDTCLDMGASITMATGFWRAHHLDGRDVPIVAIIGDSTFFHSGIPALLNAVAARARFVCVVSDNGIVAMTGAQPTPAEAGAKIEEICSAVGVKWVRTMDPYDVEGGIALLKEARAWTKTPEGGIAVVVARRPCALHQPPEIRTPVEIDSGLCDGCDYCLKMCECPGLVKDRASGKVVIDHTKCIDCGQCVYMCPSDAILPLKKEVPVP
ncbi:MAG: indolepyruvate ferredoxin oxidoreductase subunit [Planctomycetota bacterium]|nr:MAG: indolepyruvate ferredoxin oxidoreductase subunit [Planctomycetota bacterium]